MDLRFESLEEASNPSVIFRGIVGSRAYGTANAQSDTDTRGIFVVPSAEYVRLVPPPKQVSDARNDHTYYSLLRFCELMSEANPTTMEILYLPEDCVITMTPAFESLVAHRDIFITQRAVESHLGYAVSQMKKAKGVNKRVWNPWPEEPPTPEDYCMFLHDAHELPKPLKESGVDLRTCLPCDAPFKERHGGHHARLRLREGDGRRVSRRRARRVVHPQGGCRAPYRRSYLQ